MKSIKHLFTTLLLLCTTVATAHDFEAGGIYYNILSKKDKTVEVTYKGTSYNDYYNEYTDRVVIPERVTYDGTTYSVTSIGEMAFAGCTGLTNITIPNSVKSIGEGAFEECTGLTSITIPNSITSIGEYAFKGTAWYNNQPDGVVYAGKVLYEYKGTMPANTSITIKDGTLGITGGAFDECDGLISIIIPNSVTSIGYNAFKGCTGLKSITIPNSITSIESSAFEGTAWYNNQPDGVVYAGKVLYKYKGTMPANTSITIKDGTLGIVGSAFYGCKGLTSIINPNSVTSIGYGVFGGCTGLKSITIPNSVTSIGNEAFAYCDGLESIKVESGNSVYDSRENCNAIIETATNTLIAGCQNTTIPNSVTIIGNEAFYGCSGLTSITIPNSVKSIGYGAFKGTAWYNNQPDGVVYAGKVLYEYKGTMPANTSITIKDGTLGITGGAFSCCYGLTSITIPNSVTSIGSLAFDGCTSLASVTIPNSVTSIGDGAFWWCSGLTSITIPNSVTSIEYRAFSHCSGLTSVTIPNSVTSIGERAFEGCRGLTSIEIPNSVTSIGYRAFEGCTGLTSIKIPNSVTSIGNAAFRDCSGLTSIVVSKENSVYDSRNDCNAIIETSTNVLITGCQNTVIPTSVESIGNYAFYRCSGLTSIVIPNSVTSIGPYAFEDCTELTSITIPNSVKSIGSDAFSWCDGLKTVYNFSNLTFSKGSSDYGYVAYYADKVYNVPNGSVEGDFVFGKPNGVNTLVGYLGNATKITLPADYKGENYTIGADAFKGNTTITSVVIPNSVTSIGNRAFESCDGLKSITIPNSVTSIGDGAFLRCTGLKSITVETSNTKYDSRDNCNAIIETATNTLIAGCQNTIIPNSVTSIGYNAFKGCSKLEEALALKAVNKDVSGAFGKGNKMKNQKDGNSTGKTKGKTEGKAKDSGKGVSVKVGNRKLGAGGLVTPVYNKQAEGKVVVNVVVDPSGKVVSASINAKLSNTTNQGLRNAALAAAKDTKFNEIEGVDNESGTITYIFRLK